MASINGIESFDDTLIKELPLNTEKLYLYGNQISSFKCCENLPKTLEMISLYDNKISSFKGCENLPRNLKKLYIGNNQIRSFKHSGKLPRNLKELHLGGNQIRSFEHSEGLPRTLEILDLIKNQISSFNHSECLPRNLNILDLYCNQIISFKHLPKNLETHSENLTLNQVLLRYTKFEFGTPLEYIKFFQHYQDSIPILNEIHDNPRLERMKTELEEEERQIKENPELFYSTILV